MSDYKVSNGTTIQNYAGNLPGAGEGQVWYDSTAKKFKNIFNNPGAWATGGNMNTARGGLRGAGTQTVALAFGGILANNSAAVQTEKYNGTAWTEVNDLSTARRNLAGAGVQTSALAVGGDQIPGVTANNEVFNGTNWTELNNLNVGRYGAGGAGVNSTAAIFFGGKSPAPATDEALVELWNGTNWTEVNDMARGTGDAANGVNGAGTSTAALGFGSSNGPRVQTESWNGTNWTAVNDMNTPRANSGGFGIVYTSAIAFGGEEPPKTGAAETWNGTNWSTVASLSVIRISPAGAGSSTAGLAFGGSIDPPVSNATEEFNAGPEVITITDS